MTVNRELPRYRCHKEVWALKIREVVAIAEDGPLESAAFLGARLYPVDNLYRPIKVDAEWYRKHGPQPGGYYVVYSGGYTSYSPAQVFEEGYSLVDEREPVGGASAPSYPVDEHRADAFKYFAGPTRPPSTADVEAAVDALSTLAQPLPVAGYRPQGPDQIALVNSNKEAEERLLRRLDYDAALAGSDPRCDPRWLALARTHLELAFMAWNRAIFQPSRVRLPEDKALEATDGQ